MVVVVNAYRTAIGKYGGSLSGHTPESLLTTLMKNNLSSAGLSSDLVDQVIMGQTKQSAHAANIARVASLAAGIQETTPAHTVNMQCASGMQAVYDAWMAIETGQSDVVIAGGVESMSQAPFYTVGNRFQPKTGNQTLYDSNTESQNKSQPEDIYGSFNMGETAENLVEKYSISFEEQNDFAYKSQMKAKKAIETNRFSDEIIPIEVADGKRRTRLFARDEHPRDVTFEKLNKLPPVFKKGGTVTAGNSSGRNDGAASLLLMSEQKAESLGLKPVARIKSLASAGVNPTEMGIGPVASTLKVLNRSGLSLDEIDLIELNEAFAAQSLAVLKEWGEKHHHKVNVNGGAIALGHPLGSSGARILVTLIHEMQKRESNYGLATLCVAGGQGVSTIVENYK
ncbi:acetyl-CoA C-acyltransferase [Halalkalibacillus sediminis]|uniref:acetyl-CoA C-acetyltransferase n=1 Tax=Halalkalibacillus sediminis TaxID=2018042 RepID=A0A2I0QQY3_9BACI|nr:thiolase family protein [Halalkalibacillus sediminis]PKR76733.1 acetyl-CoA C-acyltransferase [Halalkalibacillus sediminis]